MIGIWAAVVAAGATLLAANSFRFRRAERAQHRACPSCDGRALSPVHVMCSPATHFQCDGCGARLVEDPSIQPIRLQLVGTEPPAPLPTARVLPPRTPRD